MLWDVPYTLTYYLRPRPFIFLGRRFDTSDITFCFVFAVLAFFSRASWVLFNTTSPPLKRKLAVRGTVPPVCIRPATGGAFGAAGGGVREMHRRAQGA